MLGLVVPSIFVSYQNINGYAPVLPRSCTGGGGMTMNGPPRQLRHHARDPRHVLVSLVTAAIPLAVVMALRQRAHWERLEEGGPSPSVFDGDYLHPCL